MSSDIALRQRILDELEWEPSLDAVHIGVLVEDGVATLTGYVRSYAERATAEQVVARIKGVRAVAQELQVRLGHNQKRDDDQIARRALKIIAWSTTVPKDTVKLKVENGWITLSGEVEWHFQKTAAEDAVRKLSGVTGVSNLIVLRPGADVGDVKHRIEDALQRNAQLDAEGIKVSVDGGKVTLEGHVSAWHERSIAEQAAWSAPGVRAVEDHIAVR
jgi:osmotically-inducible protein OsmY